MKKILIIPILIFSLSSKSQNLNNKSLDEFVKEWMGAPYRLGGKTKYGIDCSQFTKRLYKDVFGLELMDVCYKQWYQTKRIQKSQLEVGDIVFFRSKHSPSGWHCGVYIGNNEFVHASNIRDGVKISNLKETNYKISYKGAGRLI